MMKTGVTGSKTGPSPPQWDGLSLNTQHPPDPAFSIIYSPYGEEGFPPL